MATKKEIDRFIRWAIRKVRKWPKYKRSVGLMDKDRQYKRGEK